MAIRRARAPSGLRLPTIDLPRIRRDLLRRPAATALMIFVFASGLGIGAFSHLVISGDHRATEIAQRADAAGAFAKHNLYKQQTSSLAAIRDATEAQLRNDGIFKGLPVTGVLLLAAIAAMFVLSLVWVSRPGDG